MKLFSSTQISWTEPWFFLFRVRRSRVWWGRLLLVIGIAIVMFLATYFFGSGRFGLPGAIGISLAAGLVLVAAMDLGNIQREVTVKEDCIIVNSVTGRGGFKTFKLAAVNAVRLMRPAEWDQPFGGMLIIAPGDQFLVAVPNKVSLKTLADILHRLGVTVSLSEWEPSASDTRIGVRDHIELDPAAARGGISIQPVEAHEGPLMSSADTAVQLVIALGPLLLALAGMIAAGVVLFLNWSAMSWIERSLYIGGALIAVVAAFVYLVMVGQFVAAAYGVRVARKRLPTRPNSLFSGTEDDLVTVELFDRDSWTALYQKSSDYGFLRIDRGQGKLVFEGDKFRWTLPTSAITACRIEESIVGSEGNPNAEKRYYVVLQAAKEGGTWEAGMKYTRTELGSDTAESRYKRAQLLFSQLAEVLG